MRTIECRVISECFSSEACIASRAATTGFRLIVTTHEITRIKHACAHAVCTQLFFAPPFIVHGNTAVSIESGRMVTRLPLGTIDTVTPYGHGNGRVRTRSSCAAVGSGCVEQSGAAPTDALRFQW